MRQSLDGSSPRRNALLALPLVLVAALVVLILDVAAAPRLGSLTRVTTATGPGDRDSRAPNLSADGTIVAFHSDADLLNEGRPDNAFEIWLYDTVAVTYTRVTSATGAGSRDSFDPDLSGGGSIVAFESDSDFLHGGRPENQSEIWLYDTAAMTYTRVTSATGSGDRSSYYPSLSADGTVVAFESTSDLLNEGRPENLSEIWLCDTVAMTYTRVTSATGAGDRDSRYASLSADGTVVAFESDSDLLNQGIPDGQWEVWLYDTATTTFTRVTTATGGSRDSFAPDLSADGTAVAFYSDSDLLNQGIPDDQWEIWLYDTTTAAHTRVTTATGVGGRDSHYPTLNADGTIVAFHSDSDFLGQNVADNQWQIWLYDTAATTYTRITPAASTSLWPIYEPSLSADGTAVAFESDSDLLGQGIPANQWEVWLWEEYGHTYLPLVLRAY